MEFNQTISHTVMQPNENSTIAITFIVLFTITLCILIVAVVKSFKIPSNRNIFNFLTILFVFLTVLTRLACLIYSLYEKQEVWTELEQFFFFQVPFDFIITASTV